MSQLDFVLLYAVHWALSNLTLSHPTLRTVCLADVPQRYVPLLHYITFIWLSVIVQSV
jgi:hypothetical protein